ncbi:MAG: hypothetical protein A4E72_00308 [Syntrophus sp. PtaU1.Bin208]|nr:MAG: hypothetical protein A4E72_00308 [Syntrophus sp. PtaU1.Bin208]
MISNGLLFENWHKYMRQKRLSFFVFLLLIFLNNYLETGQANGASASMINGESVSDGKTETPTMSKLSIIIKGEFL